MKKKCQIIGKVTGIPRKQCVEKFQSTQKILESFGYEVVNPITLVPEESSHQDAMRACLLELLKVDAVAIQPDWFDSPGARVEYMVANALQLKEIKL